MKPHDEPAQPLFKVIIDEKSSPLSAQFAFHLLHSVSAISSQSFSFRVRLTPESFFGDLRKGLFELSRQQDVSDFNHRLESTLFDLLKEVTNKAVSQVATPSSIPLTRSKTKSTK